MRQYNSNWIAASNSGRHARLGSVGNEISAASSGRRSGRRRYDTPAQMVQARPVLTNDHGIRMLPARRCRESSSILTLVATGTNPWFFDHLRQQQVQFDIIGESYYPFWHGNLEQPPQLPQQAAARYRQR